MTMLSEGVRDTTLLCRHSFVEVEVFAQPSEMGSKVEKKTAGEKIVLIILRLCFILSRHYLFFISRRFYRHNLELIKLPLVFLIFSTSVSYLKSWNDASFWLQDENKNILVLFYFEPVAISFNGPVKQISHVNYPRIIIHGSLLRESFQNHGIVTMIHE